MSDDFKRAALPGRYDWWKEFGRWVRTKLRRSARRKLRQKLRTEQESR